MGPTVELGPLTSSGIPTFVSPLSGWLPVATSTDRTRQAKVKLKVCIIISN
jgi:hypothetical protein